MKTHSRQINQIASKALLVLSLIALITVFSGYLQPPQPDEGVAAHIFQLAIAALAPALLVFFASVDWTSPGRSTRLLIFPAVAVLLAFSALYYLEHYFYPQHYH